MTDLSAPRISGLSSAPDRHLSAPGPVRLPYRGLGALGALKRTAPEAHSGALVGALGRTRAHWTKNDPSKTGTPPPSPPTTAPTRTSSPPSSPIAARPDPMNASTSAASTRPSANGGATKKAKTKRKSSPANSSDAASPTKASDSNHPNAGAPASPSPPT
jgi:hypothetical protein